MGIPSRRLQWRQLPTGKPGGLVSNGTETSIDIEISESLGTVFINVTLDELGNQTNIFGGSQTLKMAPSTTQTPPFYNGSIFANSSSTHNTQGLGTGFPRPPTTSTAVTNLTGMIPPTVSSVPDGSTSLILVIFHAILGWNH